MPEDGTRLFEELMRFKPDGLTASGWAVKAGISRTFWNDLKRHGNPSRRTLEKLLTVAGSSLAEFEALRVELDPLSLSGPVLAEGVGDRPASWRPASPAPVPLFATSMRGDWREATSQIELTGVDHGRVIDRLPRPASLAADPDAYALAIVGDSMWPRFRPGRRIAVSPRAPIAIGDDVVVQLTAEGRGEQPVLIKELVRRSAGLVELRQFNPDVTFPVAATGIATIHKVLGELF